MRLSRLVSVVLAPVVMSLLASVASTATAAPASGGKRVARRPAPARVLPAPSPRSEALPQLPPPPRDVTAFTTLTSVSYDGTSLAGVTPIPSTTNAPTETLPALPPPSPPGPAVAPVSRDVASAAEEAPAEVKPSGWVLQVGTGALVPASSFLRGGDTLGPGVAFDLRLGYYATPHVGVLVGFRGSYGHELPGCSGSCNGYSLQAPVMLQLAHEDRTRGLYADVGLGFGTTYGGSTDAATYSFSSPLEVKLGVGYRLPGAGGARRSFTLDINMGVDVGAIKTAEVRSVGGSYSGDVDGPTHAVVALSLLSHFSL